MKLKLSALFLSIVLALSVMTGCTSSNNDTKNDGLKIVTTIFPIYDWVNNITDGTSAKTTLLLDSGVDLHSYQPTADDIISVTTCDVFIYVGGESDEWVNDTLKEIKNNDMVVIDLLDLLGNSVKEEELKEGMEAEEEESEEESEEEPEYDEHVWLSLKNADKICQAISSILSDKDKENADTYSANYSDYSEKLKNLDNEYTSATDSASIKTLLFGDRFPFRYLVDDYELDYYAAFVGCSAETEASFETITFLAKKVDELKLNSVMTIEGTDHSIAETIIKNTKSKNQQILTMNSMQGTTSEDVNNGATYLKIMEQNLEVLKEALK